METNLEADFKELRQVFNSGKTKESSWRISQLHGLLHILEDREDDISMALKQDLGKHHVEAYRDEIGTVVKSVNYALKNLNQWMAGKKASLPLAAFPSTAELLPEPLGVVLIISSWNFPFGLSLEPMIGAIAAGNAIVLKPSELAPSCSSFLAETIRDYLDNSAIKVIEGGSATGERLLEHKFDKIFFTGSTRVGRSVMAAAAQHLTPVTLELGGKCPAVVDSLSVSGDANVAAKRIVWGKFGACAGQACIGIDYILTEKKYASNLVELLKKYVTQFYGDGPKGSHSMSNIINKKHFSRLKSLLDEPRVKSSIVHGGLLDEESLFIWPTILVDPPLDAAIMTEEIFGPLLPVITLERIEESIEFIRARPKPLALYAFTKNGNFQKGLISETSSGSVMFNDVILQYAVDTLPFGGVGESGFGRYHGKYSFENFSHEKVVLTRSFFIDFWFRYPPWDDKKLQLIKSGLRFDYLGFLLIALGLKSKA
ncbi:aldehyde dehydrogenase family 3 member F1-like [Cynara cardunculus var. scolymus]|uniref:aldehyde dehydrogenase family 3 member F1-like n=1 Tax=Cynara cardunculus var. scolymus TaxID=59895 RepID=UPI000D624A27|nr:aldehyde dehydrogenase family 3 member F1-like [Cynara cardunculus var. scolymus]